MSFFVNFLIITDDLVLGIIVSVVGVYGGVSRLMRSPVSVFDH